ncbi:hypothetical protein [Rhizobium ruizarguesonis]|nr:hypothetical protein [Rhizobium ruizarguesonis]
MTAQRVIITVLAAIAIACIVGALIGSATYQPPGRDLWRSL